MTVPEEKGRAPVIIPLDPSVFAEPVMVLPTAEPSVDPPEREWPAPPVRSDWYALRPLRLPRGVSRFLGRHVLLRLLGSGPRGQSFIALPLSLDRTDVIKVQDSDRAADRPFAARFTREAFAAAQIDHPNLVPIRDLGFDRGRLFTVVVHVAGPSLDDLLREQRQLEPYQAAVMMLQAARGLRAAHDQGLWHRDVKPANLRLDPCGLVRVDDLGLEMTPSLADALARKEKPKSPPESSTPGAAGSPAYMAPEQSSDPASSDGRADIYALGGTFYHLVTGRPPFPGESAVELMRQHREEPLIPPREFAPDLPRPIADVIQTMLRKRLDERYPTMGSVVDVLEKVLDLHGERASARLEEVREPIHETADALRALPARQLRSRIVATGAAIGAAFVGLLLYLGLVAAAAGIAGFATLTGLAMLITSGITHRSEWLLLASRAVLGGGRRPWVVVITALAIAIAAIWISGGLLPWFLLILAGGVTLAFHIFIDRPLARAREHVLGPMRERLRKSRARGHDEATLRSLFLTHGGANWWKLVEALFGHRAAVAEYENADSRTFSRLGLVAMWRQALLSLLKKRLEGRRDRQMVRLLERVEEGRLEASGVNLLTARRKARRAAKAMVLTAQTWRDEQRLLAREGCAVPCPGPTPLLDRLHRAANEPEPALEPHEPARRSLLRRLDSLLSILLGRGLRFLLGGGIFVLFAVWLDANGILTFRQVQEQSIEIGQAIRRAARLSDPGLLREMRWNLSLDWQRLAEPVDFIGIGEALKTRVSAANLGTAGLLLLFSVFSGRKIAGFLAILGAAICLFGPRWGVAIPASVAHINADAQARYIGGLMLLAGFLWPRRKAA
jgi:eukaryotic-like serine/threonine-protein kinase